MSTRSVFFGLCIALAFLVVGCGRSKPQSSRASTAEAVTAEDTAVQPADTLPPKSVPAPAPAPVAPAQPVAQPPQPISFGPLPPGRDPAADASLQNYREIRAKQMETIQREKEQRAVQLPVQPQNQENRDGE